MSATSLPDLEILSMEVDSTENSPLESFYRSVRIGDQVKYLTIAPGTFPYDTLRFPFNLIPHLPLLPREGDWMTCHIFRKDRELACELSSEPLRGVESVWHNETFEILSLECVGSLSSLRTKEVAYRSATAIAKIARFPWEIDRVDNETSCYAAIEGKAIGPKFLGHVSENGRVMGLLIEKLDGRCASIEDLDACAKVVKELHALGICHGDLNRYNFVVSPEGVKLIDFENAFEGSKEEMQEELDGLAEQLLEESGRGTEVNMEGEDDLDLM